MGAGVARSHRAGLESPVAVLRTDCCRSTVRQHGPAEQETRDEKAGDRHEGPCEAACSLQGSHQASFEAPFGIQGHHQAAREVPCQEAEGHPEPDELLQELQVRHRMR